VSFLPTNTTLSPETFAGSVLQARCDLQDDNSLPPRTSSLPAVDSAEGFSLRVCPTEGSPEVTGRGALSDRETPSAHLPLLLHPFPHQQDDSGGQHTLTVQGLGSTGR